MRHDADMPTLLSTAPRRCALYVAITLPACRALAGDLYLTTFLLAPVLFAVVIGWRIVAQARQWEAMSFAECEALARRQARRRGLATVAVIVTLGLLIIAASLAARWQLSTTPFVVQQR